MRRHLTIVAVIAAAAISTSNAESVSYELYDITQGNPVLLGRGVRDYSVREVVTQELGSSEKRMLSKEIAMAKGFSVGISLFDRDELTGFGLWLKDRESYWGRASGGGFSWDWFERESGNAFRKLQGSGRVRITVAPARKWEITAVEVLEDITLRAQVRPWFLSWYSNADTHNLVVKKGSVLRFAP